ncbi:MAG TPA: hypothetical protein VII82_14280 [Polyangiaceae bacterium]
MTDPHSAPSSHASPAEDEPETPFWLPALGFALFVFGGIGWAVSPSLASATPPPLPPPTVVKAAPPPTASAPPAAPAPPVTPPPAPAQSAAPTLHRKLPGAPPGARPAKKHP